MFGKTPQDHLDDMVECMNDFEADAKLRELYRMPPILYSQWKKEAEQNRKVLQSMLDGTHFMCKKEGNV